MKDFETALRGLLNATSQENASNTPDFVLAQYLLACLVAFNQAVQQRVSWYGRPSGEVGLEGGKLGLETVRDPSLLVD